MPGHFRRLHRARIRTIVALTLMIGVAIIFCLAVGASLRGDSGSPSVNRPFMPLAEPRLAADDAAAYSRGDEITANEIASPLYRAEWQRLGLVGSRPGIVVANWIVELAITKLAYVQVRGRCH